MKKNRQRRLILGIAVVFLFSFRSSGVYPRAGKPPAVLPGLTIDAAGSPGGFHCEGQTPTPPVPNSPGPSPLIPGQRVRDGFRRYIPDSEGDVQWELEGETARFLSSRLIEIVSLTAISHDPKVRNLVINVDQVVFDMETKEVTADAGRVTVRRDNMVLTGRGLSWVPANKEIRVLEDVRLLIDESGNQGMFPL